MKTPIIFSTSSNTLHVDQVFDPRSARAVVSNHSGYYHNGSENFEHDDTGSIHNYSGVEDNVFSTIAEHEDWEEGYDY